MSDARINELAFLVVDDSRVAIRMMETALGEMGVPATNIDSAMNTTEAEEKLAQKKYDVLTFDWRMAGRSGVALMEQCRGDRAYDNVAIVIVSGEAGKKYIQGAMNSGATAYIIKPFTPATVQDTMDKVVKWLEARGRFKKPESVGG